MKNKYGYLVLIFSFVFLYSCMDSPENELFQEYNTISKAEFKNFTITSFPEDSVEEPFLPYEDLEIESNSFFLNYRGIVREGSVLPRTFSIEFEMSEYITLMKLRDIQIHIDEYYKTLTVPNPSEGNYINHRWFIDFKSDTINYVETVPFSIAGVNDYPDDFYTVNDQLEELRIYLREFMGENLQIKLKLRIEGTTGGTNYNLMYMINSLRISLYKEF